MHPTILISRTLKIVGELRFDEAESAEIFQRAAQLQAADQREGSTLAELQKIATELGIDPDLVERAAVEVNSKQLAPLTSAEGVTAFFERQPIGDLSQVAWEDVVATLRSYTGVAGTITENEATKEWQCRTGTVGITFTATGRAGRTKFRLVADSSPLKSYWTSIGLIGSVVGGPMAFGLLGATHLWQASLAGAVVTVAGSIFGTRQGMMRGKLRAEAELNQIMDTIASIGSAP